MIIWQRYQKCVPQGVWKEAQGAIIIASALRIRLLRIVQAEGCQLWCILQQEIHFATIQETESQIKAFQRSENGMQLSSSFDVE